jgi:hypothetical protein
VLATEQLGEHAIGKYEALLLLGGAVAGLQQPGQEDLDQRQLAGLVAQCNALLAGDEDVDHLGHALHRHLVVVRLRHVVDVAADVCAALDDTCQRGDTYLIW